MQMPVGIGVHLTWAGRQTIMNQTGEYSALDTGIFDSAIKVPIQCDQDIVTARQRGRELALRLGFTTTDAVLVASAISELARNVLQYAGRGDMRITRVEGAGRSGLSVVVQDDGPGIADVQEAMQNGFSTSGSLGLGLPGVKRLMDEFEIESTPGRGTTVRVKKWKR